MANRRSELSVQLHYKYDRLVAKKLSKVYSVLVPEVSEANDLFELLTHSQKERDDKDSSDLCKSFVGETKGRKYNK